MAAIFGMNNNVTADDKMQLSEQLKLICEQPTSHPSG